MSGILSDLSTPALLSAIRENMYGLVWDLRETWKQAQFEDGLSLRRWFTPIPMAFIFNAALSLLPPDGSAPDLIDETIAFFHSRGREEFDWWLWPGLETGAWGRLLQARGLQFQSDPPGMALELAVLPEHVPAPVGMKIELVRDAEGMRNWGRTFILGYQLPLEWEAVLLEMMLASLETPMQSYLATLDGQAVAASALYLGAGVAGIYNVATLPEWRGKGLGAAMTLRPLLDARQMGYKAGVLQSSELGYGVYRRLGFQELCKLDHYHWQA
jgi:ribosomal protein S18 acetylase RimI-like enzyme